jgi:hypothetical protein
VSLKNLLALQAQKKSVESAKPAPRSTSPAPAEAESITQESPEPLAVPVKKGLGLNTADGFKKPATPIPTKTPASAKPKPAMTQSGGFSLEDLAGMDAGSIAPIGSSVEDSGFPDEIEATAPDRELPADITAEQMSFVDSLNGIYGVLHDSEMFGQSVRIIMIELQENPEYEKLLSDSDVHTMIRGMRRTMGLARVRKQEKSRKAGTNKNARKTSGVSDSAMNLLNSLMGGGDD